VRSGRVRGSTTDDETRALDGDIGYARFFVDVVGTRVDE
jgi:hypothetical protein